MKTFWSMVYKRFNIIAILLVVLMLMASCQKSKESLQEEYLQDEKLSENKEETKDLKKTEDEFHPIQIPYRLPSLPYYDSELEKDLLYKYGDIYMPFSYNKWYKYNPLTNKWYSFNPNDDEKNEVEEYNVNMGEYNRFL